MNPATYFLLLGSTALPSSRIEETNHFLARPTNSGAGFVARPVVELKPQRVKNELTSSDLSALQAEILELKNQMDEKPVISSNPLSSIQEIRAKSDSSSNQKNNI